MDKFDSEKIIGKWVENTLQMRVTHTRHDVMFPIQQS
jgi:hypothetical protein